MVYRWLDAASERDPLSPKAKPARVEEDAEAELIRLRREHARLQLENDILKKAAVILGSQPPLKAAG